MESLVKRLVLAIEVLLGILFFGVVSVVILAVMDRFMLHIGFFWTEELARILFVWVGMLAPSIMLYKREHFRLEYFCNKWFTPKQNRILDIVVSFLVFTVMVVILTYGVVLADFVKYQDCPTLPVSLSYLYYSAPVGALLSIVFSIVNLSVDLKNLKKY